MDRSSVVIKLLLVYLPISTNHRPDDDVTPRPTSVPLPWRLIISLPGVYCYFINKTDISQTSSSKQRRILDLIPCRPDAVVVIMQLSVAVGGALNVSTDRGDTFSLLCSQWATTMTACRCQS